MESWLDVILGLSTDIMPYLSKRDLKSLRTTCRSLYNDEYIKKYIILNVVKKFAKKLYEKSRLSGFHNHVASIDYNSKTYYKPRPHDNSLDYKNGYRTLYRLSRHGEKAVSAIYFNKSCKNIIKNIYIHLNDCWLAKYTHDQIFISSVPNLEWYKIPLFSRGFYIPKRIMMFQDASIEFEFDLDPFKDGVFDDWPILVEEMNVVEKDTTNVIFLNYNSGIPRQNKLVIHNDFLQICI